MGPSAEPQQPRGRAWVAAAALALCAAAILVHLAPLLRPVLWWDDFEIVTQSYTWQATRENLWRPANEHTMPLGRVSTWLLVEAAGRPTRLPLVIALQGPVAVLIGMVLVYLFVRRELGHPVYGLIAMGLFGITAHYDEAVRWFAASFAILALDTVLLALLAAQRWRQGASAVHLLLGAVWALLAPCWFASGILAGPFATLYLLTPPFSRDAQRSAAGVLRGTPAALRCASRLNGVGSLLLALVPALASVAFLAGLRYSQNYDRIMHLEHYGDRTAVEAFDLDRGLKSTGRSLVDNLLPGAVGFVSAGCPEEWVPPLLALLGAAGLLWLWLAPSRRLVVLGAGFIVVCYVLIYSARAAWNYEDQLSQWGRYQLFPHLGLVFVIAGGLPRWRRWLVTEDDDETPRRVVAGRVVVAVLFLVLFAASLPRTWGSYFVDSYFSYAAPLQYEGLRRVEQVDETCREQGISAETARQVLPPFRIEASSDNAADAWLLLRGSDHPRPVAPADAWLLLPGRVR